MEIQENDVANMRVGTLFVVLVVVVGATVCGVVGGTIALLLSAFS